MKRFSFINSWHSSAKSWDKIAIKVRIGKITLFDLYIDRNKHLWGLMIFNLGIRKNKQYANN